MTLAQIAGMVGVTQRTLETQKCRQGCATYRLRTGATARRASAGSAALESVGFARAGRACAKAQRRDC